MRLCNFAAALIAALIGANASAPPAIAQSSASDEIARYRQLLRDGNPAELLVVRGEQLWQQPRGPNNVSLAACDLGLGGGVVKGAYARLPRYFADARTSKRAWFFAWLRCKDLRATSLFAIHFPASASGRPISKC